MTEAQEQETLIERAMYHPITKRLIYSIPNDGRRHPLEGIKFARRGLRRGMPDICLPYGNRGYNALYIEMKRRDKKNGPTADQLECIYNLNEANNLAVVAYGWEEAWEIIEDYLGK
jgi:hypothetical protein